MSKDVSEVAVGCAVGGMVSAMRFNPEHSPSCGHLGCTSASTEGESFRLRTAPGARYRTKLTYFYRCDEHEHSHWAEIGFA